MTKNQSGFTLIEILVSLMIATIVMGIAGYLILNSMGYFSKTAVSDVDKQVLDSVNSYVFDELIYASEVRIDTKKPDGDEWHWLYMKDNQLWRDVEYGSKADATVFGSDFYNKRKLTMSVKGFESFRMDIKYALLDSNNDSVYQTKNTLELLNLKVKKSQSSNYDAFSNVTTTLDLSGTDSAYKIYYKKGGLPPQVVEEDDGFGTVEDQLECTNAKNAVAFTPAYYETGDVVVIVDDKGNSYKYMNVDKDRHYVKNDVVNEKMWKKLDRYYDTKSGYLLGDIVINPADGKYYVCVQQIVRAGDPAQVPGTENGKLYWDVLTSKPEVANKRCAVTSTNYNGYTDNNGNPNYKALLVTKRLLTYDGKFYSTPEEALKSTEASAKPVAAFDGSFWQKGALFTLLPKVKDSSGKYGWTRLAIEWDSESVYNAEDIVWYNGHFYRLYSTTFYKGEVPAVKNASGVWEATGDKNINLGWLQVFLEEKDYGNGKCIWRVDADPYKDK